MALKGQTNTQTALWTQMIQNENSTKRNWEAVTGDHQKAKYYQGQAGTQYLESLTAQSPFRDGYKLKNWESSHNPFLTVSQS